MSETPKNPVDVVELARAIARVAIMAVRSVSEAKQRELAQARASLEAMYAK